MKKLLITGLCVLGLCSIPDARASNIAAHSLDNTRTTHQVLVPEISQSVLGSYQVARTYFMPDYQKELTGKRVNDGGANKQDKTCKQYGKKSSCNVAIGEIGKGVSHPLPGLTCYDECVSCSTYGKVAKCLSPQVGENPSQPIKGLKCYDRCVCPGQYKYSESNCIAPAELGGDICLKNGGLLASSSSTSSTRKPSSLTSSAQRGAGALYTECTCSDEYKFDYKLTGEICTSCTGQKGTIFGTFYKCTTCTGFDLRKCPIGGNCSQCMYDHTKLKLSGCNASMGYTMSATGLDCVAMSCPVGYSNTISACASGSTKPDLACSGMSGGNKCCLCKCNNINSSCTAAIYPYTSVPSNATKTGECSTGCGSAKVTRYQIKCNSGYVLKNGICEKESVTCASGGYLSSIPSGKLCFRVNYNGLTCYANCKTTTCSGTYYYDLEDGINGFIRTSDDKVAGISISGNDYMTVTGLEWSTSHNDCSASGNGINPSGRNLKEKLRTWAQALPAGSAKNVILGSKPWWTNEMTGSYIYRGSFTGGGSCGSCNNCYAESRGYCVFAIVNGVQKSNVTDSLAAVCLKEGCSAPQTNCPSGYVEEGKECPSGKSLVSNVGMTLPNGKKCLYCTYDSSGSGSSPCDHGSKYCYQKRELCGFKKCEIPKYNCAADPNCSMSSTNGSLPKGYNTCTKIEGDIYCCKSCDETYEVSDDPQF